MKGSEIERIVIIAGAGFGIYYGIKSGKNLFYFIILIWLAWGLLVANAWGGSIVIPEDLFEKKEEPNFRKLE